MKNKIKTAIEDFEYYNNGFNHLCTAEAIAYNVKISRAENRVYADIVLKWLEDGRTERYDDCYYPLDDMQKRANELEKLGFFTI